MAVDFDVAKIKILSLADHNEIKLKINLKLAPKPLNDDIISCITKSWKGRNKIDQKIFNNYKQTCPQYDAEGTAKKMKFSVKYLFSICEQIRRKLRNFSHLLKRSLRILAVWVQFNIVARVAGPQARTLHIVSWTPTCVRCWKLGLKATGHYCKIAMTTMDYIEARYWSGWSWPMLAKNIKWRARSVFRGLNPLKHLRWSFLRK